ncbi:MAG: DUF3108 domain-containing protein [Alphaproteobacteria bacterium]|nr:DUF3108 domain-containing protein [Alphaproteobacteria bacterium]
MKDILIKKVLLTLLLVVLQTAEPCAMEVKHYFDAVVGIFNAAEADFTYEIDTSRYATKTNIYTRGLFDALYPFAAKYATSGKFINNHMQTENYSYESQSRFNNRTKKVIYDSCGIPLKSVSTKNGKEKIKNIKIRTDVTDTTDLQSVMADVINQYTKKQTCSAVKKVFDGKRRYNVIFEDLGKEEVIKSDYSPYFGEAIKCSMYIDKLKEHGNDMLWKMASDSPVYLWIMRDKETNFPFIVKIMVEDTPLGELNVYTTRIEVKK